MAGAALRQTLLGAWRQRGPLAWLLWPLSLLYGGMWHVRRWLYRCGLLPTQHLPVPVIVVGNVVAGGGGKTPLVIALVQYLQSMGLRPGVIARGYGRSNQDCMAVTLQATADDVGDEPLLVHRRTGAPVQVATQRAAAARALLQRYPELDLLICDDGLQHLGLHRDIEICVFDDNGVGNGFLLPAGPLREPWPRACDLLVRSGALPGGAAHQIHRQLAAHGLRADGQTVALDSIMAAIPRASIKAVAGIAHPDIFFAMLRQRGMKLDATRAMPDHAPLDKLPVAFDGTEILLCTEKDAVKLWSLRPDALAVPLVVSLDPAFWKALTQLLRQHGPAHWATKLSSPHGHTPT
ncbi:MAG TPA: tetraacyldisaccharide 4'-kinase [Burkholderiaceae bacterium]|nr:tetraacyldisaccharide 4'-kinase [Rhodoferax sp.]HQZ07139.1 tetraacyldisaccharide 4'-kinase [Burkholderiaceae bacterium]